MYRGRNIITAEMHEYPGTLKDFYRIMLAMAKDNLVDHGEARIRIYHDNWPLFTFMGAYDSIDVVRPDFTSRQVHQNPLIRAALDEAEVYNLIDNFLLSEED